MPITYCNKPLTPKEIAAILKEYYETNGRPPSPVESIGLYVGDDGKVHIKPFSVRETA